MSLTSTSTLDVIPTSQITVSDILPSTAPQTPKAQESELLPFIAALFQYLQTDLLQQPFVKKFEENQSEKNDHLSEVLPAEVTHLVNASSRRKELLAVTPVGSHATKTTPESCSCIPLDPIPVCMTFDGNNNAILNSRFFRCGTLDYTATIAKANYALSGYSMDTYTSGIINQRTSAVRPAISTTSPVPTDTSCDGPSFSLSLSAIPFVNSAISPNNNTASAGIKYEIPANQTDYTNKTFFSQNMQSTNSNNSSARQDFIRFGSSLSESLFAAWDNSLFFSSDALVNVAEEPDNPLRHKPLTQVPATLGTEELFYTKPQSENSPVYRQTAQAVKECQDLAASKSPIHIHLRLEPPELGHVIIHVRMLGNSLEAHFRAEHLSTHTLLEQQRSLLQEHLTELGINVKTIVVSYDPEQQRRWRSWFEAPIMKTKPLTRVANELASSSEDVIVNMTA